jgi:hypothetical protein
MGWLMSWRATPILLLSTLLACSGSAAEKPAAREQLAPIDPDTVREYSRNLHQYIDALLLCGSTQPGDWAEAKKQFDILHPFLVFREDPELIRAFKGGSEIARKELSRRGVMLQSVMVFTSGTYDRAKWDEARKILMDSGEAGQFLLCTTLLKLLLNGQNAQIWQHVRFALVESGPLALDTSVGLAKELAEATPPDTAIFKMDDLVQVIMAVIGFGDRGTPALEELSKSAKLNVRRSVARAVGESKDGSALPILLRLLLDSDWMVRMTSAQAMGQMTSARSTAGPALVDRLGKERDGLVFRTVVRSIGDLLYAEAIPDLMKVIEAPSRETTEVGMQSLYILTGEKYLKREQWFEWYRSKYPDWKKKHATRP